MPHKYKEEDWIELVDESQFPPEDEIVILGDSVSQAIGLGTIPRIKNQRKAVYTAATGTLRQVTHYMRAPKPPMRRSGSA